MNATLASWNDADAAHAMKTMLDCCGSQRWATAMVAARPILTVADLSVTADAVWASMREADWLEAFACHPRIGERRAKLASDESIARSGREQALMSNANEHVLAEIAKENRTYEELFGFTYIVCATGKSAEEMLSILKQRLQSGEATELREAAEQQRQITQIRLGKWLVE